ncbi:MAG: hypothetical protein WB615_07225 [Candidatus Tumulicola sp.]
MKGLRLDKVARRFVTDLQIALKESVPDGRTLVFTITAPIRQASKTAAELEEKMRFRLASRPSKMDFSEVICGNRLRARLMSGESASKVIGYVHNPDVDTEPLFDVVRLLD